MRLVDVNLLIYAVNRDTALHDAARTWLEAALTDDEPLGFSWIALLGFVRITTHRRILSRPLEVEQALAVADGWLAEANSRVIEPGPDHWRTVRRLLTAVGTAGNRTTDAHLAALAIDNGCELLSTDSDFSRFPDLRWRDPLRS